MPIDATVRFLIIRGWNSNLNDLLTLLQLSVLTLWISVENTDRYLAQRRENFTGEIIPNPAFSQLGGDLDKSARIYVNCEESLSHDFTV